MIYLRLLVRYFQGNVQGADGWSLAGAGAMYASIQTISDNLEGLFPLFVGEPYPGALGEKLAYLDMLGLLVLQKTGVPGNLNDHFHLFVVKFGDPRYAWQIARTAQTLSPVQRQHL